MTTVRRLVRRALLALLVLLVAGVAYLSLAPVPLEPEVWRPPPARAWPGNDRLAGAAVLHGDLAGPEAIAFDAGGRVVTGLLDGRIVRFAADGASGAELLAITGGRPLGLAYDAAGRLIVADARRGLLALARDGALATLATAHAGVPFRFTDDLAIARDGTIYFTDASSRFGFAAFKLDILDHRPRGRLLAYHPATGETSLVLGDLYFANGVALGPDDAYLLVAETASYRIRRVWLRGARAGQAETFADDLPGFPDNVSYAPARRAFWVAIGSPRDAVVDALAPHPFLRKVVARLPEALQPAAKRHAWVLALDEHGRVVADLQRAGPDAYAPVSSVVERDGWLYLGSFAHAGVARARAP